MLFFCLNLDDDRLYLFEIIKNEANSILNELGVKTQDEFLKIYESYLGIRHDKTFVFMGYNEKTAKAEIGIDYKEYRKIGEINKIILKIKNLNIY